METTKLDELKSKATEFADKANYEDVINKLVSERDRLERELVKDYRSARRYVRSNPEQGVGFSLIGGIVIGFIVAKLLD